MLSFTFLAYMVEHQNDARRTLYEVDHAVAATLATSGGSPAKLANATRASNHLARFRILLERLLKRDVLSLAEILSHQPSEEG